MPTFIPPKVFTNVEISPDDLNNLFNAAAASVNNIANPQVSPSAAIDGAKLAGNSVSLSVVHDATLAVGKLGTDVAAVGQNLDVRDTATYLTLGVEHKVAEVVRAVLGGMVMALGVVRVNVEANVSSGVDTLEAWLELGGVQRGSNRIPFTVGSWDADDFNGVTVPVLWIETVAAGLHTWTLNVKHKTGSGSGEVRQRELLVWEWR